MEQQENSDVLMRGRGSVSVNSRKESEISAPAGAGSSENFTAHNPEFDRRTIELRKRMVCDRAAAEAELARLNKRCDLLKEFLFEHSSAAENLENLNSIINAEKEFSNRLEQLELRYYKQCGKLFENSGNMSFAVPQVQESSPAARTQSSRRETWGLIIAILAAALIISLTLMLVFL